MAKQPLPLPSAQSRAVEPKSGVYDPTLYRYLRQLETVVREQATHIEALRVALNEARQNPTTVYPAITL